MPTPPLSLAAAQEAVHRVEEQLRQGCVPKGQLGGKSAIAAAGEKAVADGWLKSGVTIEARIRTAKERYGLEPDWSLYRPLVYLHKSPSVPIIPSQDHTVEPAPEGNPIEVVAIGDAHDSPHLPDKSRFRWIGAYVAEHKVPWVVSMGDWITLDSMSSHTDPATHEGLAKPTFQQDIDSFHESQAAFQEGLAGWKPKKDHVMGNHDGLRPARWANAHREVMGGGIDPVLAVEEAFSQWGWRTTPYGEYRFIGGVGFIHAPLTPGTAGKTYGGKTGGQRAANDAMFDIVRGDDHKLYIASSPKIGPVKSPRIYGTGTAFPPGFIESYARKNAGDWESGVCKLSIWGGRVREFSFTDMHLLQRRYG